MTRLSILLTVLVICVISAQGRRGEHQHSNTNINENRWARRSLNTNINTNRFGRPGLAGVVNYLDNKDASMTGDIDGPVLVSHRERKVPLLASTRPLSMAGTTAYEYQVHPKLKTIENYYEMIRALKANRLIPQEIREAFDVDTSVPLADNGNVNINSNRFGSRVGPGGYGVVVPEVGGKISHRRSLMGLVNAARLNRLRSQGNTNINSNQFGMGPPDVVPVRKISDGYGIWYDPDY